MVADYLRENPSAFKLGAGLFGFAVVLAIVLKLKGKKVEKKSEKKSKKSK